MGVYIKMEMPTEGYIDVRIKCNCTASFAIANNPYFKAVEAVPVPPHGRLIDADALAGCLATLLQFPSNLVNGQWIVNTIREQPTIIEAEEGS